MSKLFPSSDTNQTQPYTQIHQRKKHRPSLHTNYNNSMYDDAYIKRSIYIKKILVLFLSHIVERHSYKQGCIITTKKYCAFKLGVVQRVVCGTL